MNIPFLGNIHLGDAGKIIIFFLSILYIASPIDLIPDFIPFLGWLDDLVVLLIGVVPILKSVLGKL